MTVFFLSFGELTTKGLGTFNEGKELFCFSDHCDFF